MEFFLGPIFGLPLVGIPLLSLAWTGFWIWMLVDAILRDEADYPGETANQRLIWVLVIAFVHIAAVPYFFVVFGKVKRGAVSA